ncbi:MAG: YlxR family protein [Lachnospiraceae bacterium]|nr:YlxR family protein [Lachnospiraceae bacterium]
MKKNSKTTDLSRKEPQRSCLACRTKKPKRELIRFIEGADGLPEYDPSMKKNGRGAYVCRDFRCFEKALKTGAFQRAFKNSFTADPASYRELFESLKQD